MDEVLGLLRHRGPDDAGSTSLAIQNGSLEFGHTRLSIIDLSCAGHQPMRRGDRFTLIFNGEIYNYRELRQELAGLGHAFHSDSDTEVLLASWEQWGHAALPRLTGMFAFALHDAKEQTLTLARDAFGIKPMLYAADEGGLVFASEPLAVLRLTGSRPRLNLQRAYEYLVFGAYDDDEQTFFEGIRHLLPGHLMTVDLRAGRIRSVERWWWPSLGGRLDERFEDAVERVREMFLQNVRLHLRSDVPLGAALSGGIDSSAVVCAMRHVEPTMPIHTFSYSARGSSLDEEAWADMVNAHVGAIPHKVYVEPRELVDDLDDMIRVQGEPFGSTSIYAQYRVYRRARESGVTVTLDGQGADELFAGYDGYPGARLFDLLERGRVGQAARFARNWSRWPGRSYRAGIMRFGSEVVPNSLRGVALRAVGHGPEPAWLDAGYLRDRGVVCHYSPLPAEHQVPRHRLAAALRAAMVRRGLPVLLRHGDRNSMRWSIESRVPFLTTDLAEYVLSLPGAYLVSMDGETKHVFRAAMRGIVPDAILDRRDKIGFITPEVDWWRNLGGTARSWLAEDLSLPFIDQRRALADFDALLAGTIRPSAQVWRWINFARWYRMTF